MGFSPEDPDIENALNWLVNHQEADGLWKVSYSRIHKEPDKKRTLTSDYGLFYPSVEFLKGFTRIFNHS